MLYSLHLLLGQREDLETQLVQLHKLTCIDSCELKINPEYEELPV